MSTLVNRNERRGEFIVSYRNETSFKLLMFPPNHTETFLGYKVGGFYKEELNKILTFNFAIKIGCNQIKCNQIRCTETIAINSYLQSILNCNQNKLQYKLH